MRKTAIVTVLAAVAAMDVMAIKGTISTETDSKSGDIKWQPRTKTYALCKSSFIGLLYIISLH